MDFRLVKYQQTVSEVPNGATYEPKSYSGVEPILAKKLKTVRVIRQSGHAESWGARFIAPSQCVPGAPLLEKEEINYIRLDNYRWEINWLYVMAVGDDDVIDVVALQAYPASPTFA